MKLLLVFRGLSDKIDYNMKKVLVLILMVISGKVYGFEIGGSSVPLDKIFNMHFSAFGVWRELETPGDVSYRSIGSLAKIGISPFQWVEIFVRGGFSDLKLGMRNFHSPLGPRVGGGVKFGIKPEGGYVSLCFQTDFLYQHNSDISLEVNLYDLMGTLYVSFKYANFYLYGGVDVSQTWLDFSSGDDYTGKRIVGVVVGMDYYATPSLFFNVEMHNFDKDAVFFSIGFKP